MAVSKNKKRVTFTLDYVTLQKLNDIYRLEEFYKEPNAPLRFESNTLTNIIDKYHDRYKESIDALFYPEKKKIN